MSFRVSIASLIVAGVAFVVLTTRQSSPATYVASESNDLGAASRAADGASTPVLVELFTSEGCSSCPPADALLSQLGRTQLVHGADVITLEEHVDYWDRLGWKDPFSSEAATVRQSDYGAAFGGEQVYTPQMVVDGHAEFVGSSDGDALRAVRAASQKPKPRIDLAWRPDDTLSIHVDALANASPSDTAQLLLAVTEDMLHSDVKRGENSGRALEHNGVVRQLTAIGNVKNDPAGFSSTVTVHAAHDWSRANLRAVVFVQERRSRHILAAQAIQFPGA